MGTCAQGARDLGVGAPIEESVKRAVLAVRLARTIGCTEDEIRRTLYAGVLQHLGCTAFSHELGGLLGDDRSAIRATFVTDWSTRTALLTTFVPIVADGSGRSRARTLGAILAK